LENWMCTCGVVSIDVPPVSDVVRVAARAKRAQTARLVRPSEWDCTLFEDCGKVK
jgi:hypothetical protein